MLKPDKSWTLFLDRDGVINYEKVEDYIHHWDEFRFYEDAVEAIAAFSKIFKRIIVVTNQKGIGKGLTKPGDLAIIHRNMTDAIAKAGGRIDAIFYCPDLDDTSPNRKPNPGMAHQAKDRFPDIRFDQSVIIGNNLSDMRFGRNAGMKTAFLRSTHPGQVVPEGLADEEASSLKQFAARWTRD
jgi:D-glycero-D-manno-heptose 1,7-bisphosphate phosphatase